MWEDVRCEKMWEDVRCEEMWEDIRYWKLSIYVNLFTAHLLFEEAFAQTLSGKQKTLHKCLYPLGCPELNVLDKWTGWSFCIRGHRDLCFCFHIAQWWGPILAYEARFALIESTGRWRASLATGYLIPKPDSDGNPSSLRPLSILSTIYRAWSSLWLKELLAWQESWCHGNLRVANNTAFSVSEILPV